MWYIEIWEQHDIWSDWWGDITWITKRKWQRQWQRQCQRQRQWQGPVEHLTRTSSADWTLVWTGAEYRCVDMQIEDVFSRKIKSKIFNYPNTSKYFWGRLSQLSTTTLPPLIEMSSESLTTDLRAAQVKAKNTISMSSLSLKKRIYLGVGLDGMFFLRFMELEEQDGIVLRKKIFLGAGRTGWHMR